MSRIGHLLLISLLAWSLVPGGYELAEEGFHLALHGDFVHGESGSHSHQPFQAEHGCGGGFHLCSCCAGQLSEPATERISFSSMSLATPSAWLVDAYRQPGHPRHPEEPPRA